MKGLASILRWFVIFFVLAGLSAMVWTAFLVNKEKYEKRLASSPNVPDGPSRPGSDVETEEIMRLMRQLRSNPDDPATYILLGELFSVLEQWDRAEFFLSGAVENDPLNTRARYLIGMAQFRQHEFNRSAATFEELLEIGQEPIAMYNLGLLYKYHLEQPGRAEFLFRAALSAPDADETLKARLRAELQTGD